MKCLRMRSAFSFATCAHGKVGIELTLHTRCGSLATRAVRPAIVTATWSFLVSSISTARVEPQAGSISIKAYGTRTCRRTAKEAAGYFAWNLSQSIRRNNRSLLSTDLVFVRTPPSWAAHFYLYKMRTVLQCGSHCGRQLGKRGIDFFPGYLLQKHLKDPRVPRMKDPLPFGSMTLYHTGFQKNRFRIQYGFILFTPGNVDLKCFRDFVEKKLYMGSFFKTTAQDLPIER